MKKLAVIAIVVLSLFVAGSAMAASFNVTNNFGIRVVEKGVCERVGSTTLTPTNPVDLWAANTTITVELLGNATVCGNTVNKEVTYTTGAVVGAGLGDYILNAADGADFFTITTVNASGAGETIVYGALGTEICFNLANTTYNSNDPNNQLVKVSYRDDKGNTYSGDIYVATVKPPAHVMAMCTKALAAQGGTLAGFGNDFPAAGLANWGTPTDPQNLKTGTPTVELCFDALNNQNQQQTTQGAAYADTPACVTIDDPSNTFDGSNYTFDFKITKTGIGIASVQLYHKADGVAIVAGALSYYDANGAATPAPANADAAVLVKTYRIGTAAIPAGAIVAVVNFAFDTNIATAGGTALTVSFNKLPCGDSFSQTLNVIDFIACSIGVTPATTYNALFPYLPNTNANWWAGLAFTNLANAAATINVVIYEADGDMYTGTVTVPANGIVAGIFVGNTLADATGTIATFTTTGSDATLGDERTRVSATAVGTAFNGFAMIGDGTQAQGYLPLTW